MLLVAGHKVKYARRNTDRLQRWPSCDGDYSGAPCPVILHKFCWLRYGANQFQVNTPLTSGSTVFVLPTRPVDVQEFADNQTWIVLPIYMTSVTRNGDNGVTVNGTNRETTSEYQTGQELYLKFSLLLLTTKDLSFPTLLISLQFRIRQD